MRIVLANGVDDRCVRIANEPEVKCDILVSYWYLRNNEKEKYKEILDGINSSTKLLYIDSGVFSARKAGKDILLKEYLDFCVRYKSIKGYFFNLDLGTFENQFSNFKTLVSNDIKTIGIVSNRFSLEEHQKFIDVYPYIGVSGTSTQKPQDYYRYLDRLFGYLYKTNQIKTVKTHGLGLTKSWIMSKYPFYSVDSSTFLGVCRYGTLYRFNGTDIKQVSMVHRKKAIVKHADLFKQVILRGKGMDHITATVYSSIEYSKLQDYITRLWEKRGLKWTD